MRVSHFDGALSMVWLSGLVVMATQAAQAEAGLSGAFLPADLGRQVVERGRDFAVFQESARSSEAGWTGSAGDGDRVFDACLRVDGNGDPSTEPRTELLPVNMVYSDGNQGPPYVYRERVAAPGSSGYGTCLSQP